MDILWLCLFVIIWLTLLDGGIARLLITVTLLYGEVREGNSPDWGFEVFCFVVGPLMWIFALMEIYVVYFR